MRDSDFYDRETSLSRTNISLRGYILLTYEKIIENIKKSGSDRI